MQRILVELKIQPRYASFAVPELLSLLRVVLQSAVPHRHQISGKDTERLQVMMPQIQKEVASCPYFPLVSFKVPSPYLQSNSKLVGYLVWSQMCNRAALINSFTLLIGQDSSYEGLMSSVNRSKLEFLSPKAQQSMAVDFVSKYRVTSRTYQQQRMQSIINQLRLDSKVNIKNPDIKYKLFEYHHPHPDIDKIPAAQTLSQLFFGVSLAQSNSQSLASDPSKQLNNRVYLGPTSTDFKLSLLMCNQAQVQSSSTVLDPFVGTGSLLLTASLLGGICFGIDLDYRVLWGKGVGRINKQSNFYEPSMLRYEPKINLNFDQFNLPHPHIIRADSTKFNYRPCTFFDAIVTDPPYGLRATSIKVKKSKNPSVLPVQDQQPQKGFKYDKKKMKQMGLEQIVSSLLATGRSHLRPGGKLVFLYPFSAPLSYEGYQSLPEFPGFKLVSASENKALSSTSRVLVTLEKEQ